MVFFLHRGHVEIRVILLACSSAPAIACVACWALGFSCIENSEIASVLCHLCGAVIAGCKTTLNFHLKKCELLGIWAMRMSRKYFSVLRYCVLLHSTDNREGLPTFKKAIANPQTWFGQLLTNFWQILGQKFRKNTLR